MYLKRVRELREARNLTQNDVCKVIGIQQPQYNRYETGKRDWLQAQGEAPRGHPEFHPMVSVRQKPS